MTAAGGLTLGPAVIQPYSGSDLACDGGSLREGPTIDR